MNDVIIIRKVVDEMMVRIEVLGDFRIEDVIIFQLNGIFEFNDWFHEKSFNIWILRAYFSGFKIIICDDISGIYHIFVKKLNLNWLNEFLWRENVNVSINPRIVIIGINILKFVLIIGEIGSWRNKCWIVVPEVIAVADINVIGKFIVVVL